MTQNDRDKTVNGAMIGGGAGVLVGTLTHLSTMPTAVSAIVAGTGTYVSVAGYGRDRELNGLQDAAKTRSDATKAGALAFVTFGALDYVKKSVAPGIRLPKGMGVAVTGQQFRMRWSW